MSVDYFFLHGGPAMSAAMERACYPERDDCYWWDQPRPAPGAQRPYRDLLLSAEAQLRLLAQRHDKPLGLLANSFGAVVATHLAQVAPTLIARIVLLAPVSDLRQGLLRVARRVLQFSESPGAALRAAWDDYHRAPGREAFWALFLELLSHPALVEQYWLPGSPRAAWFAQMLSQPGMFELAAHMAIADDYQRTPLLPRPVPFSGPVEVVIGAADALVDPAESAVWWRQCFPEARVRLVAAAHFPHLELPLEIWRP